MQIFGFVHDCAMATQTIYKLVYIYCSSETKNQSRHLWSFLGIAFFDCGILCVGAIGTWFLLGTSTCNNQYTLPCSLMYMYRYSYYINYQCTVSVRKKACKTLIITLEVNNNWICNKLFLFLWTYDFRNEQIRLLCR